MHLSDDIGNDNVENAIWRMNRTAVTKSNKHYLFNYYEFLLVSFYISIFYFLLKQEMAKILHFYI